MKTRCGWAKDDPLYLRYPWDITDAKVFEDAMELASPLERSDQGGLFRGLEQRFREFIDALGLTL